MECCTVHNFRLVRSVLFRGEIEEDYGNVGEIGDIIQILYDDVFTSIKVLI